MLFFARTMHPKTMEMIEFERGHWQRLRTVTRMTGPPSVLLLRYRTDGGYASVGL